ncbi:hypothetical protein PG996_001873 [Apiospora saccharicola]|uniref:RING-type domain-containing protein n=1 Tax=Apiospora saccharicola TaxID=335842 RepID=A0ABR1WJ95_9PEZI
MKTQRRCKTTPLTQRWICPGSEACLICHEESPLSELVALVCAHIYHPECITRWWNISPPKECPYCKQKARSFGHACGQPGACSVSSIPDTANPFLPGPLPVCLPCDTCGQLYSLLDAKRILKLIDSLYCNQLSLRSLLSLYDGTDLYDYDQWRERDRKEMEEKGYFHYCQRNRSTTAAANVAVYLDNGRAGGDLHGHGDKPILKAPTLYFEWLFAFERLWYRTRALDIQWEMADVERTENTGEEEKEELQRELDDLAAEYSWRMAYLVHVRDVITAKVKQDKRGKEFQQLM